MVKPTRIILSIIAALALIGGILWFAYLKKADGPSGPVQEQPAEQESQEEIAGKQEPSGSAEPGVSEPEKIEWDGDEIDNEFDSLDSL
jgi:hypothetical protein